MDFVSVYDATTARRGINKEQKAWKFIRDVNSTSQDDLNKTALEDGNHKYSYGEMFREWERYASVFSALGMTGDNQSRVGLLGSTCVETIFSFYGLNMVGADVSMIAAYSAVFPNNVINTIRKEKLTDFIVTDDFAQMNLVNELFLKKNELGLKNIILLHVPVNGVTVEPMMTMAQEAKYAQMKKWYGSFCMDNLLRMYGNRPISYTSSENSDTTIILHTSGTTTGAGKPVALSDKAFNSAVACFFELKTLSLPYDNLVTSVIVDLSNAYAFVDQVHLPFAVGAAVTIVPWGALNPNFYKAVSHYRISFLFTISAMFERWMKMPQIVGMDFSSLSFVVLGGASVSAADKRRFYEFVKAHGGSDITLLNGYGISELGGACCLSTPDLDDESIGYPLPGINVRLFDDESGSFLPADQRPGEGVLYLNAPSLATITLDGEEIMKVEYEDGQPYICTNDLVRQEEDGRIVFLGRANRYFINEEGRKYESGRVETEFSRQPDIENCCVVPVYIKVTHDNIPMLCVKTLETAAGALNVVRKALRNVFITEKTLQPDHVPSRVMIAKELPRNGNGKIDLFKISKGEVEGQVFTVEAIRLGDNITEFQLIPYQEGPADMIKDVMDGISGGMKGGMPFGQDKANNNQEGRQMNDFAKTAFENFNNMNQMGMQMMNNMMSGMGNMNQEGSYANAPFWGMPNMQGMPDMQKMMENMQGMMSGMQGMMPGMQGMPDMQKMMENMQGMMSGMQGMMPGMQGMPDMQKMMESMQGMMPNMQGMPDMQKMMESMQGMMPDMQKMMESMQGMMPNMQGMMPDMQKMMSSMQGMMPDMQGMMPDMTGMMPDMQKMMEYMQMMTNDMSDMNRKAVDNMKKMKPDMQKMMNEMMKKNKKMAAKMQKMTPDMQITMRVMENMYKKAIGMMPAAKVVNDNMQEMAQIMGTAMQQQFIQMVQCISQMNKIGFEAMQKNLELNRVMTEQFMSGVQAIVSTDWVEEGEKFKAEAEKDAKAEAEPVKEEVVETVEAEVVEAEPVKEKKPRASRSKKSTKSAKGTKAKAAKAEKAVKEEPAEAPAQDAPAQDAPAEN